MSQLEPLDLIKINPSPQLYPLRLHTPPSGPNRFTSQSMLKNSKTERIQKWDPKSRHMVPSDAFTKFSKSSKNLKISSEISESIHKISSHLRSKIESGPMAKPRKQHEFFKKKNISHKRGMHSDFGVNSRKYFAGNMRQSSASHQQHLDAHSRGRHPSKFGKTSVEPKPGNFSRKWNQARLQKKKKEQKWEKDQMNRIRTLCDNDTKNSLEDIYPSESVGPAANGRYTGTR